MTCTAPLHGYRTPSGTITLRASEGYRDRTIPIACGQCIGCKLRKASEWTTRLLHEAQSARERGLPSAFLTLTYDDEHLPNDDGLHPEHWQGFAKRLRKRGAFRFYHCGEYGEKEKRPHYHAIIFGHDFREDRKLWKRNQWGDAIYVSPTLAKLWGHGYATLGAVTPRTAAYVAKYCTKKVTGPVAEFAYLRERKGSFWWVRPEYATMSLKPGIGAQWFERYHADIYPSDETIIAGKHVPTPKYYDTLLLRKDQTSHDKIKEQRIKNRKRLTTKQLEATQTILLAQLNLKRKQL